jgi:rod shape determining protein RodA
MTMLISFKLVLFVLWISLILLLTIFSTRRTWLVVAMLLLHIGVGSVTPMAWNKLHPYQQKRITTFLNPEQDPRGSGYQIIQSQVAIGSGGFWGKGFMNGTQSQLKFLPAQHTDFIFSVVAEEWGLFGVTLALILFFGLILYLLDLATDVRSSFSSFALIGLTSILIFHVFINIAMTIGFAPVTGLPLPFFSYGRSFLISIMLMMGLVMNFSANQFEL